MVFDDRIREDRVRQIDRLVDGDLSESERRDLLLALEREPDGWRACALAFLEAQGWRGEIGAVVRDRAALSIAPPAQPLVGGWRGVLRKGPGAWLSLAAVVMVSFALGLEWRGRGETESIGPGSPGRNDLAGSSKTDQLPVNRDPGAATDDGPSSSSWGDTRLVFDERGNLVEEYEVPLVDPSSLDRSWQSAGESPFSDAEREELERQGFTVVQRRKLTPYRTNDGKTVLVPEHEVEVVPARHVPN